MRHRREDDTLPEQQVQQPGDAGRGEEDVQELSQLHLPLLFEGVQKGALATSQEDLPALPCRQPVQTGVVLGEGGPRHAQAHLRIGETRPRVPRAGRRQVFLLEPRGGREVRRERFRRPRRAHLRPLVRSAREGDGRGIVRGGDQTVQVVQP